MRLLTIFLLVLLSVACGQDADKHLFVLSGQSNMVRLNPEESFIPTVNEAFGSANVIVVKDAQGGQPIRRWYRDWTAADGSELTPTGDLYDRLMAKVDSATAGKTIQTVTFVWMQGERDAREEHGGVYYAAFNGILAQLREDLGVEEVNFVIGRLSDFDLQNQRYPDWTTVREAQVSLAQASDFGSWVDTDDLNDGLNRQGNEISDDLHMSEEGYRILGERFAGAAITLVNR